MKKLFALVLVAMFGFAFACGATPPAVETPEVPDVETPDVLDDEGTEGDEGDAAEGDEGEDDF